MQMKTILCPVDLSTNSLNAINVASSLAHANQGEVVFLFVAIPELPTESGYAMIEADAAVRAAREELERLQPTLAGVKCHHEVRRGDPATEIVRFAHNERVDLILMPTHGYGVFRRLLLGSVTAKVLHDAD